MYFVADANSGLGKGLSRMLYSKNGKVYITARSEEKLTSSLILDFADLGTIKVLMEKFLAAESGIHALFNNAGYMGPRKWWKGRCRAMRWHFGVNCLGPFILTNLLLPTLVATAREKGTPPNTVRVICLASFAADLFGDKDTILDMDNLDSHIENEAKYLYGTSKAGDCIYGFELSKRYKTEGIIGLRVNPGNLKPGYFRDQGALFRAPKTQTAIIQSQIAEYRASLPFTASEARQVPALPSLFDILVRIPAVTLNSNDYKMLMHFLGRDMERDATSAESWSVWYSLLNPQLRLIIDISLKPDVEKGNSEL
ncbi:hypothetical protein PISL3812_03705 [Talaromyces islandicus]|uniref:Uncharacterized protein n=1 Tax=Talaromyces islandicus TaxID=28573 RepID=A0A0U1LTZ0_TALIS|nr:hypothetical protein PISL3812_03705 [Talaromyces islandicus]